MIITLREHKIEFGYEDKLVYSKDIKSIYDFKSSFLKRLGNIKGSSNKSDKEYQKIKPIVKSGNSIKEIVEEINRLYRWKIEIKEWFLMATEKQVKYVQSLQKQYNIDKYTKEQISNMSHQEIIGVVNEFEKCKVKKIDKATSSQVELIMEMQDEAEVKWYNRREVKKFSHQEIESLVIKLKNEVKINEMSRKAWKDQVNMWKEFE